MELLPREEWSAASCHETVIAERVASLASLPVKPLGTLGSLTAPGTWHHELFAEPGAADRPVTLPTPLPIACHLSLRRKPGVKSSESGLVVLSQVSGARNPADGSKIAAPLPDDTVTEALQNAEAKVEQLAEAMERAIAEREGARIAAQAEAERVRQTFEEVSHRQEISFVV